MAGGAERGSPGLGACPSSSGRGNAWLQPAFGDSQLLLVPRTFLSPGLMRDAYRGMLPWPQRPYKLTGDVNPPSQKPVVPGPRNWAAGSGDPRFAPSLAAGRERAHKSSAVLIPLRLWFFFLFPLPYISLWGSGVTLPVAGALPWLCCVSSAPWPARRAAGCRGTRLTRHSPNVSWRRRVCLRLLQWRLCLSQGRSQPVSLPCCSFWFSSDWRSRERSASLKYGIK